MELPTATPKRNEAIVQLAKNEKSQNFRQVVLLTLLRNSMETARKIKLIKRSMKGR